MKEKIKKLEHCLKVMKRCLKIPNVENCICFSDAFKVLDLEVNELYKKIDQTSDLKNKAEVSSLKEEIEKIKKNISQGKKECLECRPCVAALVFKTYPDMLNKLYQDNQL